MPIYEYGCSECGKHIEVFQKINDEPLTLCNECGGELSKLISSTSFVLKGGGWYADGYSSQEKSTGEGKPAPKETKSKDKKSGDAKEKKTKAAASAPADK
ncbi:FmdB family zinc ribbon protein [Nitrospirota bacterium]